MFALPWSAAIPVMRPLTAAEPPMPSTIFDGPIGLKALVLSGKLEEGTVRSSRRSSSSCRRRWRRTDPDRRRIRRATVVLADASRGDEHEGVLQDGYRGLVHFNSLNAELGVQTLTYSYRLRRCVCLQRRTRQSACKPCVWSMHCSVFATSGAQTRLTGQGLWRVLGARIGSDINSMLMRHQREAGTRRWGTRKDS
jgi:hypothetical protein